MKKNMFKILASLIILGSTINGASAKTYPDLPQSHWAYNQINLLSDEFVVVGYPDGTFQPDEPATRAEFATMVIKALKQENAPLTETFNFSDVTYSHWAYNTIQRAIGFDLIKNTNDELFRPEDTITKAEAVAIIISAVNTGDLTIAKAKEFLSIYKDADTIPNWAIIAAGKSEMVKMTAHSPKSSDKFDPDKKITRAEIAVNLYNMREQAKVNPNAKLAEAMKPRKGEGTVIDGIILDGNVAILPKGTVVPVVLASSLSSQTNETGEVFVAKVNQNLITKEKFLLILQGGCINGQVSAVKAGRYFVRNGKLMLDTKNINTTRCQCTPFIGTINTTTNKKLWEKIVRFIFKGGKINLKEGQVVYVKLDQPVKIDLTNGWILE